MTQKSDVLFILLFFCFLTLSSCGLPEPLNRLPEPAVSTAETTLNEISPRVISMYLDTSTYVATGIQIFYKFYSDNTSDTEGTTALSNYNADLNYWQTSTYSYTSLKNSRSRFSAGSVKKNDPPDYLSYTEAREPTITLGASDSSSGNGFSFDLRFFRYQENDSDTDNYFIVRNLNTGDEFFVLRHKKYETSLDEDPPFAIATLKKNPSAEDLALINSNLTDKSVYVGYIMVSYAWDLNSFQILSSLAKGLGLYKLGDW